MRTYKNISLIKLLKNHKSYSTAILLMVRMSLSFDVSMAFAQT